MKKKEIRGNKLLSAVKKAIPNVGFMTLKGDRKVTCVFRGFPFVISSYLVVKEQGLGSRNFTKAVETEDSNWLQERLRV